MTEQSKKLVKQMIKALIEKDYAQLESTGTMGRLTEKEIEQRIFEYGHNLINIPDETLMLAQEYIISDSRTDVVLPLWTQNEGQSDLTISFLILKELNTTRLVLNDIEVL